MAEELVGVEGWDAAEWEDHLLLVQQALVFVPTQIVKMRYFIRSVYLVIKLNVQNVVVQWLGGEGKMKIAIASLGTTLEAKVDARFGRCPYFLIVDTKTNDFGVIKNTAGQAFQGAGISAAQLIANKKVKAVLAGNFGPKAVGVLSASGIKIFAGVSDLTAKQALEKYKDGKLKPLDKNAFSLGMGIGKGMGRGWNKMLG